MWAAGSLLSEANVETVRRVVDQRRTSDFVLARRERNVNVPGSPVPLTRKNLWRAHMRCLLTSQQRAGCSDPVPRFLSQHPYPLSYERCLDAQNLHDYVLGELRNYGGIRYYNKIAEYASRNLRRLDTDGWAEVERHARLLRAQRATAHSWGESRVALTRETDAADYQGSYIGFGMKQSRNYWQLLGLSRYLCVLDRRARSWCIQNLEGMWGRFDPNQTADYIEMAGAIRELCRRADVLPCIFDAAAFSADPADQ